MGSVAIDSADHVSNIPDLEFEIPDLPLGYARHLRIVCIGAGASGLCTAYQVRKHLRNVDLIIYEKNPVVGGTWYENKYPGCACDIPAHNYELSWSPNPNWSSFYVTSGEIFQYFKDVAKKHDLEHYIKFQHTVKEAVWNEESGKWRLKIFDATSGKEIDDECDVLLNAAGFLNNWKWPDIPGLSSFKGDITHTANWKDDFEYRDKKVAVVGNGSSGMQVLVSIYPEVKTLTHFIRSPTWVTTNFALDFAGPGGTNFQYSDEQKAEFANDPEKFLQYRKAIEKAMCGRFRANLKDSTEQAQAKQFLAAQMLEKLGDHPLSKTLLPEFGVGCRRATPGLGYLETLTKENVRVVTDPIDEIVPTGIKLQTGEVIELDAIVLATGFDYSWVPRFPIIGRNGISMQNQWKERPTGYLAVAVNNFPNYLVFMGPNSALSHGSALIALEIITKYMLRLIYKLQTENYKSFTAKESAVREFTAFNDKFHERTIWGTKCRSWLKGGKDSGAVLTYPGSRIHNIHIYRNPRFEDYEWTSQSPNRFAYFGNGLSVLENAEDEGRDTTWYLTNPDEGYDSIMY